MGESVGSILYWMQKCLHDWLESLPSSVEYLLSIYLSAPLLTYLSESVLSLKQLIYSPVVRLLLDLTYHD